MAINLLDLVKDQVTGQLAKQASSFLGESESSVTSALGGIFPTLLGSVIDKSSSASGAKGLMDMIGTLDLDSLGDIAGLFGGGSSAVNSLLGSGGGIIDALLGNKTNGVIDLISSLAGLKKDSSSSLLKMAAPFLIGLIGKQIKGKGVSGLTDLLLGQKSSVASALPAGMGSLLGLADFGGIAPKVEKVAAGGNSWLKWLLPLLLAVALIYFWGKGCANSATDAANDAMTKVEDVATDAANAATDAAANAAQSVKDFFTFKLPSGFELVGANKGGIEDQLVTFIQDSSKPVDKDTWFNFDRLLFETGSANLLPESKEQLTNIAEILKAFPQVTLKIGGYTDNTGDPTANQRLSTDRAFNVMNDLVAMGVAKERLTAEGYGDKHPVADNSTEEGRAMNRRIAVRVTNK
ncbi:MAG: OmpA family protein [Saprospiraceae bacterium]|nr:MAG: outer membrane protein/peptidoglycan-associated (lipo)protein [Bacteroidetes bacterium OLB9]MCO6464360.1 OmpA family protein [Saprospiraceae bacterium]